MEQEVGRRRFPADRLSGGLLLVAGLYAGYEAWQLPLGGWHHPDAGFFPLALALTLVASSGWVFLRSFGRAPEAGGLDLGEGTRRIAIVTAALVAYVFVLDRLGFIPSTALVMILMLRGLGRRGWRFTLALALASVVVAYVVFRWLGVPLPSGIVPF